MYKSLFSLSLASLTLLVATTTQALPVPNTHISIAGAGGDFTGRYATLSTTDKTTTKTVKYGLRTYDLHIAKMIEVSGNYCQDRPADYLMRWNYLAAGGTVFMGEYTIPCTLSKNTLKKFGTKGTETLPIDYAGNEQASKIPVLNFTQGNAADFAKFAQTLKPTCIETSGKKICPGDRLE